MVVDLHIHTNRSSYCSSLSPDEMLETAAKLGLDAVAVTEHSTYQGAQIAYEMGRELESQNPRPHSKYKDQFSVTMSFPFIPLRCILACGV